MAVYKVLLVEDDPGDANLVRNFLSMSKDVRFELTWVVSLSEALSQLHQNYYDILLVDLSLPDSRGLDTVQSIRSAPVNLPLIVLSGHEDTVFALDILESGVQDYIVKGRFDSDGLTRAIRYAVHRSKLEQRLQEAEERWRFALDGAGDGVWDWNLLTGEVFYSRRWKEILGFADDEIGNHVDEWEKRVHPLDWPIAMANIQAHLDGKTNTYSCEQRLLCKDGRWRWMLDRGVIVSRTKDGSPKRMIGTLTDVSHRKNLEQALHEAKQFAVSTIDALSAHICVLDKNGTIMAANRAWREFYQNNLHILDKPTVGVNYLELCIFEKDGCSGQSSQIADGIRSVMNHECETFMKEFSCRSGNKTRWFSLRVTRFDDDDEHFVVAHEDITERKHADERDRLL